MTAACRRKLFNQNTTIRKHSRYELSENLTLCAPGVIDSRLPAVTVDVSYEGMCLMVPDHLPIATAVLLQWNGAYMVGQVRHSSEHGSLFKVGIKLDRLLANTRAVNSLLQKATDVKVKANVLPWTQACPPSGAEQLQPAIA